MHNPISTLIVKGLRVTPCRKRVLEIFSKKNRALSQIEIENEVKDEFDRVTLYRTLTTFTKSGVLHKVPNDSGAAKFALCKDNCDEHIHKDEHVHFKCLKCNTIKCINTIDVPTISLPSNYKVHNANLIIEGICPSCNK